MIHLKIKNVQSIKEIDLTFKGFTVIRGPSDIGKTAIVRAINGLLNNSSSKFLMRHNEKNLQVIMSLSQHKDFNDVYLEWNKGDETSYIINDTTYNKIGSNDVNQFTDDVGIITKPFSAQIRTQYDNLFLIEVSSNDMFNNLLSGLALDKLQKILKLMQEDSNDLKSQLKVRSNDLDILEAKRKNIAEFLRKNEDAFNQFKNSVKTFKENQIKKSTIENLILTLKDNELKLKDLPNKIKNYNLLFNTYSGNYDKYKTILLDLNTLKSNLELINKHKNKNSKLKELISKYINYELFYNDKIIIIQSIITLNSDLKNLKSDIDICATKIKDYQLTLEDINSKLSKFSKCPTCGQVIKEECKNDTCF